MKHSEKQSVSQTGHLKAASVLPEPIAAAVEDIPGVRVAQRSFADLTTLRVGGTPRAVVECGSAESLAAIVRIFDDANLPILIVGGGSNLVVGESAEVTDLFVVLAADAVDAGEDAAPAFDIDLDTGVCSAFAGVEWDRFVAATVELGLGGLECLSGIPGSVGATPVQNVGAYGAEVSQVLRRVRLYDRTSQEHEWVQPESLDLAYRYSNLKFTNRAVVTEVEFQLDSSGQSLPLRFGELARRLGVTSENSGAGAQAGGRGEIRRPAKDVRAAVLELRAGKGMVLDAADHDTWSAGSFFTNPVISGGSGVDAEAAKDAVVAAVRAEVGDAEADSMPLFNVGSPEAPAYKFSAAWLIERAGFHKGWHVPGNSRAGLSTKHTLALTNRGEAESADIVELAAAVRDGVFEAFGVELVPEPVWVGCGCRRLSGSELLVGNFANMPPFERM